MVEVERKVRLWMIKEEYNEEIIFDEEKLIKTLLMKILNLPRRIFNASSI